MLFWANSNALLRTSAFFSFTYNILLATTILRRIPLLSKIWNTAWRWQNRLYSGLVKSTLHGQSVILTNGHWYSLVCRMYPKFNQPLYALVKTATDENSQPINVVDIGAAVGDTVLFLEANFPGKIGKYLCIDGDTEFFSFQEYNLKSVKSKSTLVFSLLSDKEEMVSTIDKKDPTTGSAIGNEKAMSKTLDQVLKETNFGKPDVIKIDIDGFDGKALGGAIQTLKEHQPLVIFEWNTPLFDLVGNDILQPFQVLSDCGYSTFIWFTNLGDFALTQNGFSEAALFSIRNFCEKMKTVNGHHFDVIALHSIAAIGPEDIVFINETLRQSSAH